MAGGLCSMAPERKTAYTIIFMFGIVALFGDIIYEGARSVTGPYLYLLGASAIVVGIVSGLGEFLGYLFRLISGFVADSTRSYWVLLVLGYGMLLAVPLLAFAGSWELAAALFIIERIGKGIRSPAKDTILSNVSSGVGRGVGYGIHETLDQVGAIIGPLVFSAAFLFSGGYQAGFFVLFIPFILLFLTLFFTWRKVPDPSAYEPRCKTNESNFLSGNVLVLFIFAGLTMAGFAAFPLIAYHFAATGIVTDAEIPLFYAIAMGADAAIAIIIGKAYDRFGPGIILLIPLISIAIPFLAFGSAYWPAFLAVILYGLVLGINETVLRAAVADITHISKRGRAFGIFNTIIGVSWFAGSVVTGFLYTVSIPILMGILAGLQVAAIVVMLATRNAILKPSA